MEGLFFGILRYVTLGGETAKGGGGGGVGSE